MVSKVSARHLLRLSIVPAMAWHMAAHAQSNSDDILSEPLDPDKPLTEFPDFGVDWPDMDAPIDPVIEEEDVDVSAEEQNNEAEARAEVDADETADELADQVQLDPQLERKYSVELLDLPDTMPGRFYERFDALSALEQNDDDPANVAQIRRRMDVDAELLEQLLAIEGYYDAIVTPSIDPPDGNAEKIIIRFSFTSGPIYKLGDIELSGLGAARAEDIPGLRSVHGLESGNPVRQDAVVAAKDRLNQELGESGYAFASVGEPELVIDHAERDADLTQPVSPGDRFDFGRIVMPSTELFGPDHVQMIARFDPGDLYRESDLEDLRRALIATGLVSTVNITPVRSDDPELVDIEVDVTAAPLRTIAGEIGYGTGEGFRAEVSWEHRNFFPPEGLIRASAVAGTQEQGASLVFRRNNFRRRDQVLNARLSASNIERDAFDARTIEFGANIERQSNLIFQKRWSWSAGFEVLFSQERDGVGLPRQDFYIGALPGSILYDTSDDLLDPTTGFRIGARLSPEISFANGTFFYGRAQIDGSYYYPVNEKLVLAGRARIGSIVGAGNNSIAPSRRFYAGGGGSVRGYGFQDVGPRDANNDPIGGRSLVEFSLEARIRTGLFGGALGIVPFIDAGNVYTSEFPEFDGLRYGAGIGIRYYSNFGPIRVDVGTPINPQPGDSRIAVYVSLGQAF